MKWARGWRMALVLAGSVLPLRAWVPLRGELWPDGPIQISFDLAKNAPANSTGDWDAAVVEAMNLWNAKLQRVQLVRAPLEGDEAWYLNGRNEVFFDRRRLEDPFPSNVLAVSFATYDRGVRVENDIIFNATKPWAVFRGPQPGNAPFDFRRVALHELGHLLGLDHPDEAGQKVAAIMNSREGDTEIVTADDEGGIRALYDFGLGGPPVIVGQPTGASVIQGATVRLSVFVGGRGPLAYEWQRDGAAVAGGTRATLNLVAGLADRGSYVAVVRNGGGSVPSEAVRVDVRAAVPPLVTIYSTANGAEQVGSEIKLTASLAAGDRPMSYLWRKDGEPIVGKTGEQLILKDVQFSDSGNYTVTATNAADSMTSSASRLSVVPGVPPTVTFGRSVLAVAPSTFFRFSAPVDSSFSGGMQWLKDGVALPGATGRQFDITSFQPTDVARYSVVLSNPFGRVTADAGELLWYENQPLTITRQPAAATVYVGASVVFEVESDAVAPSYQWFKRGVALPGQTARTLAVPNVRLDDCAIYTVEVRSGGNVAVSKGAELQVVSIPGDPLITLHPSSHSVISGSRVDLSVSAQNSWQSPAGQALSYQWFREGQALLGATGSGMSLVATAAEAARYFVRVSSAAGTTQSETAEIEIVSSQRLIPRHPASSLVELDSETLRLDGIGYEIAIRRGRASYAAYFYSKGTEALAGTPFALGATTPGTYTLTIRSGNITETSRPFTIGFYNPGRPMISRHPAGGAYDFGASVILNLATADNDVTLYDWRGAGVYQIVDRNRSELRIPSFGPYDVGDYFIYVRNVRGQVASETIRLEQRGVRPPIIVRHPAGDSFEIGQQVSMSAEAARAGARFQWWKDGRPDGDQTASAWQFIFSPERAGTYSVVVTDSTGSATSRPAQIVARPVMIAPVIATQPVSVGAVAGGGAEFFAGASGLPLPAQYQWRKNGVAIPGATDAKLRLRGVQPDQVGTYTVVISNAAGSVVSQPATLAVDARARLINLATRAAVGRGANILFAGFVIRGTQPRDVLVRGIGEQLGDFGVAGVLRDPVISLYDSKGNRMDSNDDWFRTGEENMEALRAAARQSGAFALREDAHDGALLANLAPGSYTAQVVGLSNTTGVGLVEIYELGVPSAERFVNLSSRAFVGTGANILIPGLVLSGQAPRRLLFRAVGPGLAELGVAGVLADPIMKVFRGTEVIAQNDNWGEQPNAAQLAPAMAAVGAFPLKAGSRDAVLLLDLPPGSYTVQVAGVNGATGIALVEIYEVAP